MSLAILHIPLALLVGGGRAPSPSTQPSLRINRRALVQGAGLAAMVPGQVWAADVSMGSKGISAYEKLQLDKAIGELNEAIEAAKDSQLKPSFDSYIAVAKVVSDSSETKTLSVSASAVTAAGAELKRVVATSGQDGYVAEAASIDKKGQALLAACKKSDPGPAAVVTTKLVGELTDLAYEWTATQKPLAELNIGIQSSRPTFTVEDGDINKTMKRQL
eukprot:scaffold33334_cov86-Phaeocystis_antarctica.AAC.1